MWSVWPVLSEGAGNINAAACRKRGIPENRRRVLDAIGRPTRDERVEVIDKPSGTSRAVVEEVKRVLGIRKAGHTGTLDPMATGVLPVCLGEATKLVQFLALDDKEYRATLLLGVRTDTLDTEGAILEKREPRVGREQVEEALRSLVGKREQTPPLYSAVKFRGRPLYDWTRRGIEVEQLPRDVEVFSVRIDEVRLPEVTFTLSCSKGTYIRSLCAEVGEMLAAGGACRPSQDTQRCLRGGSRPDNGGVGGGPEAGGVSGALDAADGDVAGRGRHRGGSAAGGTVEEWVSTRGRSPQGVSYSFSYSRRCGKVLPL